MGARPRSRPDDSLLAERLAVQRLSGAPATGPVAVARHLLAVQAQDPRGFRLAIRSRTRGLLAGDVDRALTEERSMVVSWLCRGTLHLVASEDYRWLHALTTAPLATGAARRLADEGVSPDAAGRAVEQIRRALSADGPLPREELAARVARIGVSTGGQAMIHILFLATLRGLVLRGPMLDGRHAYALVDDWLGPAGRLPERSLALAELARRYLRGHGPAGERDLARWAGLPLRDARAGLDAIAPALLERPDGLVALRPHGASEAPPRPPGAKLLGAFDPLLVGWRDRTFVTGPHDGAVVSGGMFRAVALSDGRARAVWRMAGGGEIALAPVSGALSARERALLEVEAADVRRYLGLGARQPEPPPGAS